MTDDLEGLQKKNNCMIAGEDVSGRVFAKWEDVPQVQVYDDVYVNVFESLKGKNEEAFKEKQRAGTKAVESVIECSDKPPTEVEPFLFREDSDDQSEGSITSEAAGDLLGHIVTTPSMTGTPPTPKPSPPASPPPPSTTPDLPPGPDSVKSEDEKGDGIEEEPSKPTLPQSTPTDPEPSPEPDPISDVPADKPSPSGASEPKDPEKPSPSPPVPPSDQKGEKDEGERFNYLSPEAWKKWWNTPSPDTDSDSDPFIPPERKRKDADDMFAMPGVWGPHVFDSDDDDNDDDGFWASDSPSAPSYGDDGSEHYDEPETTPGEPEAGGDEDESPESEPEYEFPAIEDPFSQLLW
uniref:Uncharacterized protein n=1 Tax=Chromera velia CCMP2878 TaxID=1169474 RepID=A0A0G4FMQ0_9ALVE|eukprot:Cvel_17797.t1-p1 / transcript=Cvel_17797.t1 / gene=Cvel_17797 / organism=Chromera_velia_CCMP2878 / gene_product=hypothetical protein / transcript_product=hypothetical protein / location=Cvel_scaffold1441:18484-19530(+) / protein_length=349 / sequence_SO=supercontig / SO=protein_coding / is_pseudo=false